GEKGFRVTTWTGEPKPAYKKKDMDRLERQGKAKRQNLASVPDVASLSQLLRTIGAYVEEKHVRLVKIARHGDSIAIQYDTVGGKRTEGAGAPVSFDEVWVKLY